MSGDLLQTKLFVPRLRPFHIPRPHLIDKLNKGFQQGCNLTLISAPAGFGKTTLVSEWVNDIRFNSAKESKIGNLKSEIKNRVAWLSLDEGDNDLTRFLIYLIATLQTVESNFGKGLLAALQSPEEVNIETALITLVNEFAELSDNFALILDDYHVIESLSIDRAVTFLVDHIPPQLHLVLLSRIDPSLPLSRLRAGGKMFEIRIHDLRFTTDEAATFLNMVMGFELSVSNVVTLERQTEGWIAGLQMAALSIQGYEQSSDITDFVNRFAGSDRYIQDYLADEVLQQRPQGTRDFLLQTAILRRLSAPLCDAVTKISNSQTVLESLEAANLFIISLDNKRHWYRYHHLFSDLLVHRLHQTFPEQIPDLHRRASTWFEKEGLIDDAVRHAQAAAHNERIVDILEKHWQEVVHRGEVKKLRRWLDALGPEYTKKSAPLSMAYCWIHVLTDKVDSITSHLKDVKAAMQKSAGKEYTHQPMRLAVIPSLVETMEATISLDRKQAQQAKAHAQKAIFLIPDSSNPTIRMLLHGAAAYRLAEAHRELGEYNQACAILLEGLAMLQASENYFGTAVTLLRIVTLYQKMGKTAEAITLCEESLVYIDEHHWEKIPPSGLVNVILADLQADSGDFTEAKKNLELGRESVKFISSPQILDLVRRIEKKLDNTIPASPSRVDPLTPREIEVLQLIAEGYSNREISERLFLALDTVKGHNRRIYEKLGVKNRTQAVNTARNLQIITV